MRTISGEGTISGVEPMQWDSQSSGAHEEKILVSVRLRPLSEKEIAKNDASDWECVNNTTIIYKNALPERSMFPPAYSFDRVFGCDAATKEVYMEGAKQVALSVLDGINSSIFAYGQTSSGKTYTMTGITEYAMADIYDYIQKRKNREFVLKFSAMEIYNEAVRDLLSSDSTPLRLLDDPERGTIVEKLTEETLRDHNHLIELLSVCEAQRQSGETSLNETSSRSHQILRLTIESSGREFLSVDSSSTLSATVNFVDLAGSERASQTLSAGARLKEGCHINRSLLTLGTVIRKLSKGRNGHIPFRDSKLTRILQSSLGGNSRTAIICTMSPARSHVEQSRNTLLFASCAKEVATKAQVNVLMSDKTLVKHLQRELARLETELRSSSSPSAIDDSASLLKERELQIDKMTKEIKELTRQRDLALSRAEDLLQTIGTNPIPGLWGESQALEAWRDEYSVSESPEVIDFSCVAENPTPIKISHHSNKDFPVATEKSKGNFLFDGSSPQLSLSTPKFFRAGPHKDWEISHRNDGHSEYHCEELLCVENEELRVNKSIENDASTPGPEEKEENLAPVVIACEDATDLDHSNHIYDALKQKIHDMQKMIDRLVSFHPNEHSPCSTELSCQSLKHSRSRSCNAVLGVSSPTPWFQKAEQDSFKNLSVRSEGLRFDELKPIEGIRKLSRKNSEASLQSSEISVQTSELSLQSSEASVQTAAPNRYSDNSSKESREEAGTSSSRANVLAKPLLEKESFNDSEREPTTEESRKNEKEDSLENTQGALESHLNWPAEFRRQRREIIKLWDSCNVPLVHRTYFFLLFNGADQSDSVYIEVELRRLSFLKDSFYKGTEALNDGQTLTLASSARALRREREALSKRVMKKFSRKEMQSVYKTWGIGLRTKRRRLQLVCRLWTDTEDVEHAKASAAVVAKLVGFVLPSNNAPKEMFGLSFLPQLPISRGPYGRKPGMPGLL